MILIISQFILILSVLVFAACEPSDERIEITETRELGDFNPKPKLNLGFRDRVGIEEKKPQGSSLNNVSFFVKLTGPKAIVDAEMDNFNLFCNSLKIGEGNPPFKWEKPESWKNEDQSSMRVANFSFGENSEGECYFTVLPGGGGGDRGPGGPVRGGARRAARGPGGAWWERWLRGVGGGANARGPTPYSSRDERVRA